MTIHEILEQSMRKETMTEIHERLEQSMIRAHQAGVDYYRRNKPVDATREQLELLARSCGWHHADCMAWLAGFYGAKRRDDATVAAMRHMGVHEKRWDCLKTCVHEK